MQDDTSILLAKGMHFETGPRGPSELSSIDGPLWVLAHLTEPLKLVGGPGPPLWKIWTSIGMMTFPIYGKIKLMFQTTNQITFQQETWSIGELAAFLLVESRSKSIATDRSDGEVTWFQCRFWSSMPCWESEDHGYLSIPYHEYLWINGFKWLVIHTRWCPSSLAKLVYKYYN